MIPNQFKKPVLVAGALGVMVGAAALSNAFSPAPSHHDSSGGSGGDVTLNFDGDYGDPVARDLSGFRIIRVKGGTALEIRRGDFEVQVAVEDDEQDAVETTLSGDVLSIDVEEDGPFKDLDVKVIVTMPDFGELDVHGAVDARIIDVDSSDIRLDLRGAGNIEMDGTCGTLVIELRGAGNVQAEDLKCSNVDVDVRGAGNAEVYASDSVRARLRGIGNIDVYGSPTLVDKKIGGIGAIDIH